MTKSSIIFSWGKMGIYIYIYFGRKILRIMCLLMLANYSIGWTVFNTYYSFVPNSEDGNSSSNILEWISMIRVLTMVLIELKVIILYVVFVFRCHAYKSISVWPLCYTVYFEVFSVCTVRYYICNRKITHLFFLYTWHK